jgi:hypothetical protein
MYRGVLEPATPGQDERCLRPIAGATSVAPQRRPRPVKRAIDTRSPRAFCPPSRQPCTPFRPVASSPRPSAQRRAPDPGLRRQRKAGSDPTDGQPVRGSGVAAGATCAACYFSVATSGNGGVYVGRCRGAYRVGAWSHCMSFPSPRAAGFGPFRPVHRRGKVRGWRGVAPLDRLRRARSPESSPRRNCSEAAIREGDFFRLGGFLVETRPSILVDSSHSSPLEAALGHAPIAGRQARP